MQNFSGRFGRTLSLIANCFILKKYVKIAGQIDSVNKGDYK
ncbi:hypothetical protein PARA125_000146 [Parachlamydia sp. AcF125]|nr:hypothetical protein [Parachlamydia sp. AcF125]